MERVIKNAIMEYHNPTIPFPNTDTNNLFGILKIKMQQNKNKQDFLIHQHFIFSIDGSTSMNEYYKDNKTKLDYILFTLENMIQIFAEKTNISIHINVFDSNVRNCITNTLVTPENVDMLINKIKQIKAISTTNIECALNEAKLYADNYKLLNPHHKINHIFLTDGVPTSGNTDINYLKELISTDYPNVFIGYGLDHDPIFMAELASNKNGSYYFIDAFEKAGLVYGEIIFNILYVLLEDVTINISNAEIYDYVTNTWNNKLFIGNLVVESEKIYQIRSSQPDKSLCIIQGNDCVITNAQYLRSCFPTNIYTDLTKYAFRQKTQELLYETNQYAILNNRPSKKSRFRYSTQDLTQSRYIDTTDTKDTKEEEIKLKLKNFMEIMESYIKDNSLENDKFMKMLQDDLTINYTMIGSHKLRLYSCARQTSQGRQGTYTVSLDNSTNNIIDSPYATQSVLYTMNQMSQYTQLNECDTVSLF